MNPFKEIFKEKVSRIWFIVTAIVVVLALVINILSMTLLRDFFNVYFGGGTTSGRGDSRYFEPVSTSKEDAYQRGNEFNIDMCEEGFVLLKNQDEALPLEKGARVSVFGKNSVNLVYGGSGSGGGNTAGATTIFDSLESAGFVYNHALRDFYENDAAVSAGGSGPARPENPSIENSGVIELETYETPFSAYSAALQESFADYNDAALIVISRIGGEGFDLPRTMPGDPNRHYLELDPNEKELIRSVVESPAHFDAVILIINSSSTLELGDIESDSGVDACIQIGGPGYSGVMALGSILNGEVNPSGHTVDTWAADFTQNPTWNNFGNNMVASTSGQPSGDQYTENGNPIPYYFVDYEEGIYVGYRYYETRGYTDGEDWYQANVVYPFGYGLSYTQFDWEIVNTADLSDIVLTEENKTETITIDIQVTNTGEYAGKDVVQLYCTAPYTTGGIEKAQVVLVGFAKTPMLWPADEANDSDRPQSAVVSIEFSPYSIASYDDSDANGNGFRGYELEGGSYSLSLRTDAHTPKVGVDAISFEVLTGGVRYDEDPVTKQPVINRFEDADEQLDTVLSRADWEATWPTQPNGHELNTYSYSSSDFADITPNNPNEYTEIPAMGAEVTISLVEMMGKPYDDADWDLILDALTIDDMKSLFNNGAFQTSAVDKIGKPATIESDGPVGFTNFISDENIYGTVAYASEVVIGSTWSVEMLEGFGNSVGEEGIWGKQRENPAIPYSGWYAPGINIHRSPFGGRNFEYFSEDGFLSGKLAAAQVRGALEKGVYTFMKHFALNEQETNRDNNGSSSWATEQAMRELYFKPFEIAVKDGGATGVMSSFNRIGTRWTGGDYRLLTEVLRGEWGFRGTVICDFNMYAYMNNRQMAYAGGDLNLRTTKAPWASADANSAADVTVLRNAAHNILYTVVNSNAMNGIEKDTVLTTGMAPWQLIMIIVDVAVVIALAVWGFLSIRFAIKKSKEQ